MSDPYQAPDPHSTPQGSGRQPYEGYTGPTGAPQGAAPQNPSGYPQGPQGYPQQQGYGQPGYPAQQGYGQPGYPQYAPEVPGRTMGIVGFVLAFVIAPAGIVVSAMALAESRKAGAPNPLGTWGLWLSIAFTALGVLAVLAWFGFMFSIFATLGATTSGLEVY